MSRFYSRNFKTLASLCGCTGRFASGLVGNSRRHVLSCRGLYLLWCTYYSCSRFRNSIKTIRKQNICNNLVNKCFHVHQISPLILIEMQPVAHSFVKFYHIVINGRKLSILIIMQHQSSQSAQSDQSLLCPHEESLGPWLPTERTAKTLIRLGGCPG